MTSSRTFKLAPAVSAVAAGLAIRRRARRLEAAKQKTDLQAWDNEGGSLAPSPVATLPS